MKKCEGEYQTVTYDNVLVKERCCSNYCILISVTLTYRDPPPGADSVPKTCILVDLRCTAH